MIDIENLAELKARLPWEIYYTGSLNLAYLSPHQGYWLTEHLRLGDQVITKGHLLFIDGHRGELEIFTPEEWAVDARSCYKVEPEIHQQLLAEGHTRSAQAWETFMHQHRKGLQP